MVEEGEYMEEPTSPLPAMWDNCVKVYERMDETAQVTPEGHRVWKGFTTKLLFEELDIPVPYYGKVLNLLKSMNAIQQIRRGGRTSPSEWRLHNQPTPEAFREASDQGIYERIYEKRFRNLEGQVASIRDQLGGLDVKQALSDLQGQIREMQG